MKVAEINKSSFIKINNFHHVKVCDIMRFTAKFGLREKEI